ncbi:hypothetical protein WJX73_004219 [Symbiochloris irregularis]|uniref:Uncharacterized protein n=1 Tax=Symbiochloris irregularis TaxID=706552 RepID=A0AAW1PY35_9CHLO
MEPPSKKPRIETDTATRSGRQAPSESAGTNKESAPLMGPPNPQPSEEPSATQQQEYDQGPNGSDAAGEDAALQAAHQVKKEDKSEDAMFAALEHAEEEYERNKQPAPPDQASRPQAAPATAAQTPQSSTAGRVSAPKKPAPVDEQKRQLVRESLLGKLLLNGAAANQLSSAQQSQLAHKLEAEACDSSTARATYFSKIGNAVRRLQQSDAEQLLSLLEH